MAKRERVTIPAGEVRAGDRLHTAPGHRGKVASVEVWSDHPGKGGEWVEVFTDDDPLGMPLTTLRSSDPVIVWRKVPR
jgi:hypothetical protein